REENGDLKQSGLHRVIVCLSSLSPNSSSLLRKGSRLASRLNAPWYAVYIQSPRESLERVGAVVQRQTANTLALAHQLGGVPMTFKGTDVVKTIAAFVKEYSITHVLVGRTRRPWYCRWFGPSLLERLLREVPEVDVIVVGGTPEG